MMIVNFSHIQRSKGNLYAEIPQKVVCFHPPAIYMGKINCTNPIQSNHAQCTAWEYLPWLYGVEQCSLLVHESQY